MKEGDFTPDMPMVAEISDARPNADIKDTLLAVADLASVVGPDDAEMNEKIRQSINTVADAIEERLKPLEKGVDIAAYAAAYNEIAELIETLPEKWGKELHWLSLDRLLDPSKFETKQEFSNRKFREEQRSKAPAPAGSFVNRYDSGMGFPAASNEVVN